MSRKILKGSISLVGGLALAVAGTAVRAAGQNPPPPTQTQTTPPAQTAASTQAPAPADTPPPVPNRDPHALGGLWKVNTDLSSDTSKLQQQTDNATQSAAATGSRRGGGGFGFGHGGGGGGGGNKPSTTNSQQGLETRALLREMADTPQALTVIIADDTTTFTDDQGLVRKFTTNGKKETIDLGTAQVDSISKWDGGVLTVELTGGNFKLTETYQLTVQGHELVVALASLNTGNKSANTGAAAVPIKRIYDRADAGK